MNRVEAAFAVILIILSLTACVSGHSPILTGGNEGIENAVHIDDPLKSWALYGTFPDAGSVSYYAFSLEKGDRLWFSVFTPENDAVYPEAVVIGPGIGSGGELSACVFVPENNGYIVIPGKFPDFPDYEPFTPAANYQWLKYEYIADVPGTYYIAMVNNGTGPGNYGLAVGYKEEFTLSEWVLIPLSIANVRIWEGSSPAFVVGFPLFIVWIGLLYLFRFKREPVQINPKTVPGVSGGLLYIAGSVFMLIQGGIALYKTGFQASFGVTAIFILIPLILGFLILRYMVKPIRYQGIKLLLLGALGLVVWAGYVAGPVLVILSGMMILFKRRGRAKQP
jgi:hypothetical protein